MRNIFILEAELQLYDSASPNTTAVPFQVSWSSQQVKAKGNCVYGLQWKDYSICFRKCSNILTRLRSNALLPHVQVVQVTMPTLVCKGNSHGHHKKKPGSAEAHAKVSRGEGQCFLQSSQYLELSISTTASHGVLLHFRGIPVTT